LHGESFSSAEAFVSQRSPPGSDRPDIEPYELPGPMMAVMLSAEALLLTVRVDTE
jgi:hypothetical protein